MSLYNNLRFWLGFFPVFMSKTMTKLHFLYVRCSVCKLKNWINIKARKYYIFALKCTSSISNISTIQNFFQFLPNNFLFPGIQNSNAVSGYTQCSQSQLGTWVRKGLGPINGSGHCTQRTQCTKVGFTSFPSGRFSRVAIVNLPEGKLVNLTSVQWYITISTQQNQKLQKAMVASSNNCNRRTVCKSCGELFL